MDRPIFALGALLSLGAAAPVERQSVEPSEIAEMALAAAAAVHLDGRICVRRDLFDAGAYGLTSLRHFADLLEESPLRASLLALLDEAERESATGPIPESEQNELGASHLRVIGGSGRSDVPGECDVVAAFSYPVTRGRYALIAVGYLPRRERGSYSASILLQKIGSRWRVLVNPEGSRIVV